MTSQWTDDLPLTHAQTIARHLEKADSALVRAEKAATSGVAPAAQAWAAVAQAHLLAANVKDLLGTVRPAVEAPHYGDPDRDPSDYLS